MDRLANLDKLRGFAALSVVLYHVIEHTGWTAYPITGALVWGRIGWMGVDLFFVISGLVITLTAWRLNRSHGSEWGGIFWQRRLRRIVPLYLLTGFVYLLLVDLRWLRESLSSLGVDVLAHLLFIHNLFPSTHGSINGVNWTIGVEMQFYLLVFLALPWLVKARISTLAMVFFSIAWIWRGGAYLLLAPKGVAVLSHYAWQLPGVLDQFFMGILICKLVMDARYSPVLEWLARHYAWLLAALAATTCAMLWLFWKYDQYWTTGPMVTLFKSLIALCACLLLLAAILCPWTMPRLLSAPFDLLGEWSYGLYLWHLPVILMLKGAGLQAGVPFLAWAVLLTIALAAASYYFFERGWMLGGRPQPKLSAGH